MKKKKLLTYLSFLICFVVFFGCAAAKKDRQVKTTDVGTTAAAKDTGIQKLDVGYVEDVTFDRLKKKERITLYVSKASKFKVERISEKTLMIKAADMFVPEGLRRKLGEDLLKTVNYVLPVQKTIEGGKWVYFEIALRKMIPYSVKSDKKRIVIDLDVSALPYTFPTEVKEKTITPSPVLVKEVSQKEKEAAAKKYTKQKISLDFQDADIKTVLRLLAESGNTNIISGEDVKGNVTVHMKNVPWDHALNTILEVNSLGMKKAENVITVHTLEKMRKEEEDRKKVEEAQIKEEAAKGKLRQISIEARIVEAKTTFSRKLGIEWGGGYQSGSFGFLAGTNPLTSGSTSLPTGIGLTGDTLAVNFPVAIAAPSIGMVLGGTQAVLDAQLHALETTGDGKIISSPKITTLDNVKATIKQGEEVPYAVYDKEGNKTIEFKEAVLQLDAKPKITPDGRISMEIKATNDYADWQSDAAGLRVENPPVVTNSVESTIVVSDGNTIVVGGIYKLTDTTTITGVPGLSKIPILGWLFKSEVKSKVKREILIFITPRIVQDTAKGSES